MLKNWLLPNRCICCHYLCNKKQLVCHYCQQQLPHHPDGIYAYQPPIDYWITQLKFHQQLIYARALANLMIQWLVQNKRNDLPPLLLPVPLHRKRLQQRGFNQAIAIAKPIAQHFNIKLDLTSCRRIKNTHPQSQLPAKKRATNVRNAFVLDKPIKVKHIAIVDDVITTGHTSQEVYQLLVNHGVERVEIWACAKPMNS